MWWERDDLALQNIQARVRAPGVWMLANIKGGLLLSTVRYLSPSSEAIHEKGLAPDVQVDQPDVEFGADPPAGDEDAPARLSASDLRAESTQLLIYRTGLVRGETGTNELAYQVVVTNGASVRDAVFVHAMTGKVINRYTLVDDALFRRAVGHPDWYVRLACADVDELAAVAIRERPDELMAPRLGDPPGVERHSPRTSRSPASRSI